MPKSKRRGTRSSEGKYIFFVLAIIITAVIIGVAIVSSQPKTKLKATEYLRVVPMEGGSLGEFYNQSGKISVRIKILGLNITAFEGDAHSIIVIVASQEEPEVGPKPPDYFLPKGETWQAVILLKGLVSNLNSDGLFPVNIGISCTEAEPENSVWLYLRPEDILSTEAPD